MNPHVIIVVLGVYMHCEACAQEIKKRIQRMKGQSQPPCHLSVFLEVTDSRNSTSDWSCFVSHSLSVVNQRKEEKSIAKESQNHCSKAAKEWDWREHQLESAANLCRRKSFKFIKILA